MSGDPKDPLGSGSLRWLLQELERINQRYRSRETEPPEPPLESGSDSTTEHPSSSEQPQDDETPGSRRKARGSTSYSIAVQLVE
jgi:hypothetical protein